MTIRYTRWKRPIVLFTTVLGLGGVVHAGTAQGMDWVESQLEKFDRNPEQFSKDPTNVAKYDPETLEPVKDLPKFFTDTQIKNKNFVYKKDFYQRSSRHHKNKNGKAPIWNNDLPQNLVDELKYTKLQELEENQLMSANLPYSPWSDDYWPIYSGVIAKRYADPYFPRQQNWANVYNYVSRTSCSTDSLSPAEKYDLLVGDYNKTLTQAMLNEGRGYYQRSGYVETWMGICHGWAPASYMLGRPQRAIQVPAANGGMITFYPSDIKALGSLLWANVKTPTRFIGGRCHEPRPPEDANGRVLRQDCFDTNPGTWHLAVTNQIGAAKRSFVMDSTYDYQVWNQPIYGYKYVYFNPRTKRQFSSWQQAVVSRREFNNDRFYRYRSSNAAYVVGVAMQVIYIAETAPTHNPVDSEKNDRKVAVNYLYDLELDQDFNILGGEWYNRQHPDFLFTPGPSARALSVGDKYLIQSGEFGAWDARQPVPASWTQAARQSSRYRQPLAAVVETLIAATHTY